MSKKNKKTCRIVVAGDISIDWLHYSVSGEPMSTDSEAKASNWRLNPGTRMVAKPGGALLLARMVKSATKAKIDAPKLDNLEKISPVKTVHSVVQLDAFPASKSNNDKSPDCFRIKQECGFAGPENGNPTPRQVNKNISNADIVILDDAGNGFRDNKLVWPRALAKGRKPIIIFKMNQPIAQGALWRTVLNRHAERTVVVVSADDLRAEGVNISQRLSWERTAKDFMWQLVHNPTLKALRHCQHLIVRFGIDGAIYSRLKDKSVIKSQFYYDPLMVENGFGNEYPGGMLGFNSAFVTSLAAWIAQKKGKNKKKLEGIGEGVKDAIYSARRLYVEGFGPIDKQQPDYPCGKIFGSKTSQDALLASIPIPIPTDFESVYPESWGILENKSRSQLEKLARNIVLKGINKSTKRAPIGEFGLLKTLDRTEIESFYSIKNLILEYLQTPTTQRPLSIAVFGPPGSGKSFGVTEVAKSVAPGKIKTITFNVSQFQTQDDLSKAFHKVRNIVLGGDVPLVFFDEFDSAKDEKLGWLKFFLAPMQDGEFKDGESMHPIGRAIFVFAGGTSSRYEDFCCGKETDPEQEKYVQRFVEVKGPDFISRLRGYVNILGIDAKDDKLYMVRRAIILRSILERFYPNLIENETKKVRIDPAVLAAIINVRKYKHGVRSMGAILEMSLLVGRRRFEQACLPSEEQLKLHVDATEFKRLVDLDVLIPSLREKLGKVIHEHYRKNQKGKKKHDDPSMKEWSQLDPGLRRSNRQQARDIPEKLRSVGCAYIPVIGRKVKQFHFTKNELNTLAKKEHKRWLKERIQDGWVYGEKRCVKKKISPYLIEWEKLDDAVKQNDYDVIEHIPLLMESADLEIIRLNNE